MSSQRVGVVIFTVLILLKLVDSQKNGICPPILDIAILIDTSGGLDSVFEQQINWTIGIVKELPIHEEAVRISLLLYAEEAQTEFNLSKYSERNDIIAHLGNMRLPTGNTKTGIALQQAKTMLFDFDNGARYNSNRIIIIFTDGLSMDNPIKSAKILRRRGVKVLSISVNSIGFVPEMLGIVGDADHIFGPMDEERLQERLLDEVEKSRSCDVQPKKNEKTTSAFTTKVTPVPESFFGSDIVEESVQNKIGHEIAFSDKKTSINDHANEDILVADALNEISGSTTTKPSKVTESVRIGTERKTNDLQFVSKNPSTDQTSKNNTSTENKRSEARENSLEVELRSTNLSKNEAKIEDKSTLFPDNSTEIGQSSRFSIVSNSQLGTISTEKITSTNDAVENITITSTTPCVSTPITTTALTSPNTTPPTISTSTVSASTSTIAFSTTSLPRTTATTTSATTITTSTPRKETPRIVASTTASLPSTATTITTSIGVTSTPSRYTTKILPTTRYFGKLIPINEQKSTTEKHFSTKSSFQRFTVSFAKTTRTTSTSTTTLAPFTSGEKLTSTRKWTPTRGPNTLAPATTVFPTLLNMEKTVTLPVQKISELKQKKKIRRIIKRRRNISSAVERDTTPQASVKEIRQQTTTSFRRFSRSTSKPIVTEEETEISKNVVQCPMDILFVVDSSGSIAQNYDAQKDFLTSLVKKVEPSRGHRVGLIQFAGPHLQKMEWSFDAHSNNSQLLSAIRSVRHLTGTTYIGAALELSLILLDSRRKHTETTVLLVSDGFSQDDSTQQAKLLRQLSNVKMYAISLNALTNTQYLTDIVGVRENLFVNDESAWFEEFFTKKLRCVPTRN